MTYRLKSKHDHLVNLRYQKEILRADGNWQWTAYFSYGNEEEIRDVALSTFFDLYELV